MKIVAYVNIQYYLQLEVQLMGKNNEGPTNIFLPKLLASSGTQLL